ncbi:Site-specific DNA recombinase [Mesobacillus persicus]|uniref:Site-specific DNA recombinase n=1 Tax=Mesobacillus persicus TaxID=930146 RepID=A0A1H7XMJ7_9BACI|nr:recombinase family protein [Mesobacillus persicus]SEM34448.1 Site-specific DNA recombinase [Mesobacillus persicus]
MSNENIAAIYVRVSTLKASQKDSPEHQKAVCLEKARMEELDPQFFYEDKSSGTSIVVRDEIKELLEDAKKGYFQTIIFASLSRFSRDALDAVTLKRKLVNALGIRLISIDDTYDSQEKDDEMIFTIISAVNQKLSEQISLSSRRGIRESARSGNFTGSFAPFGYKKVKTGNLKTLEISEDHALIVKQIFEWYCYQNMGEKSIIEELNKRGIPSPKGGLWGITTVQRMLQNEAYTGRNVFNKYTVEKHYDDVDDMQNRRNKFVQKEKEKWLRNEEQNWEPIIDDETFQKAQEMRLLRGGGKRGGVRGIAVNAFAGIAKCAHCDSNFVSMKTSKKGKKEYRYLICSRRRRIGTVGCENGLWIPYESFRDELLNELTLFLQDAIKVDEITERVKIPTYNHVETKEKDKDKYERMIQENRKLLFELRKDRKLGEIDEDQYQFEKNEYEKEIENLQDKLRGIKVDKKRPIVSDNEIKEQIRTGLTKLQNLDYKDVKELQMILQQLLHKVEIDKDGNIDVFTPLGKL